MNNRSDNVLKEKMRKVVRKIAKDIKSNWETLLIVVVLLIVVRVLDLRVCPSVILFDFPCPGCGVTRASMALLRGDVMAAIQYNPAVFAWAGFVLYWVIERYFWEPRRSYITPVLICTCLIVLIIYGYRLYFEYDRMMELVAWNRCGEVIREMSKNVESLRVV